MIFVVLLQKKKKRKPVFIKLERTQSVLLVRLFFPSCQPYPGDYVDHRITQGTQSSLCQKKMIV